MHVRIPFNITLKFISLFLFITAQGPSLLENVAKQKKKKQKTKKEEKKKKQQMFYGNIFCLETAP